MTEYNQSEAEYLRQLRASQLEIEMLKSRLLEAGEVQAGMANDLRNRNRSLHCHDSISLIVSDSEMSVKEACDTIVALLPESWQYPDYAESCIRLGDRIHQTPGYGSCERKLVQEIKVDQQVEGFVEVCYPDSFLPEVKDLFLPEETTLLFSVAIRIGNLIGREEKKLIISETEGKYRSLIESVNDVIYEVSADGTIVYVSPAIEKVLGFKPEELTGKNIFSIMHPDDRPVIARALASLDSKDYDYLEYRYYCKDGSIRWVRSSSTPIYIDGRIAGGRGSLVDIHERMLIQEKLQASEVKYRNIFENTQDVYYEATMEGTLLEISPSIQTFSHGQYSREELIGKSILTFYTDQDQRGLFFAELFRKGAVTDFELAFFNKDGSVVPVAVSSALKFNPEGHPEMVFGSMRDISERKKAQEKLEASEQKYKVLFYDSPVAYLIIRDGIFIDCNTASENIYGSDRSELVGKTPADISPAFQPNGLKSDVYAQELVDVSFEKGTNSFEWVHQRIDGTLFLAKIDLTVIGYEGTRVLFVSWQDITSQREAEDKLRKLSQAVEQSPVSIVITDLMARIEYVNPAFEEITGYRAEEVIGKNTNILKSGKTDASVYQSLWKTIESGKEWHAEWVNKKKDGTLFWEDISISPIYNLKGIITNYLAIKQDVTSRKQTEQEILDLNSNLEEKITERTNELANTNQNLSQEIEERKQIEEALIVKTMELENFFVVALDLLSIADTSGNFIRVNKAWENILGYSVGELEGRKFMDFVHPDDRQPTIDALGLLSDQNPLLNFVNRYRTKDGSYRFIEWRSSPAGKLIYSAARDITNRKKLEDDINKAREDAEQANLAKSEFLSRMSHELRTPMNSILGFAQLLEMGELTAGQSKGVSHILRSGKHLLDLINEVLDISRIEAGRLSLSMEPVQLKGIINETLDILKPQALSRNLTVELVNTEFNQLYVKSDRQRLMQILLNLVSNAIKYNKDGGFVGIFVETMVPNPAGVVPIRISVSDTGEGIDAMDIPKLFTPFERIGAENSSTEGTGLGLAVVKKLIDAMGGDLGVESTPGKGSNFWIEMPQCESQLQTDKKKGPKVNLKSGQEIAGGTILYIEDNTSNLELVEQILSTFYPETHLLMSPSGRETLHLALKHQPDLVLLDLNLPDVHGSVVLKQLQKNENTCHIPVVVISADAMNKTIDLLLKNGARKFLTKPLDVQELLQVVEEFVVDRSN